MNNNFHIKIEYISTRLDSKYHVYYMFGTDCRHDKYYDSDKMSFSRLMIEDIKSWLKP